MTRYTVYLLIVLLLAISTMYTASAQSGAELISITVSHPGGVESYLPSNEIILPEGDVKISLIFKGLRSGQNSYLINAPFAQDVLSSSGTVINSDSIWVLKIYNMQGQSFTIDIIGSPDGASFINIIQNDNQPVNIAYIALHTDMEIQNETDNTSVMNLYNLAENNIAKVGSMGIDTSLMEAKLENARLKMDHSEDDAIEMLNIIIQETQELIDTRDKLKIQINDIKNRATTANRLDDVASFVLNAEKAIENNNFAAAERDLDKAEDKLRPNFIRDISPNSGYVLLLVFIFMAALFLYMRIKKGGQQTGGFKI